MGLLSGLKDYLNISYKDQVTDRMLKKALERGKTVLDGYAGKPLDYEKEGAPRQLLYDYCRYVRSQATEMFEVNYKRELMALREQAETEEAYADRNATEGQADV